MRFNLIGCAHNQLEYYFKKKQSCSTIALSPIFFNPKFSKERALKPIKFNLISINWSETICALGGVNFSNIGKISHSNKIKSIAYQIFESFAEEKEIILAGIASNGYVFAEKIGGILKTISDLDVILCEVKIDKQNPFTEITTSIPKETYKNKNIVLVDDVLNSGSTLIYGVKHFLELPVKKIKTAVLVDRNHKKFPVKADFKGISLSTSFKEHVQVVFEDNNNHAYLV